MRAQGGQGVAKNMAVGRRIKRSAMTAAIIAKAQSQPKRRSDHHICYRVFF
jgi:hypothetical protein